MPYPAVCLVLLASSDNLHLSVNEIDARLFAVMNPIVPLSSRLYESNAIPTTTACKYYDENHF
jgi:hypothetical protein